MNKTTRRNFLKASFLTAASLSIPVRSWSQVIGANSTVRAAVVGVGGRGGNHISSLRSLADKGVRIVAYCDVDQKHLDSNVASAAKLNNKVEPYTDIRKLLENPDIDVVTIATPNHWHALAAIWSIQAGKDVYVEKPVSHEVWEGRKIIEAARQYGKIVQTGTQSRSSSAIKEAVEWVNAGNLGKIRIARGLCYKRRDSIGKTTGPQPIPPGLNYDLWSGPAPLNPPRRNDPKFGTIHYDWHWFWDYGNGDLGNQGIHQMDVARWFLGARELSPRTWSVGGRFGYDDDGETPNTQIVYHDFPRAPLIFEVRGLPSKTDSKEMDKFMGGSVAVIIECEGGYVLVPNYVSAIAYDKEGKELKQFKGPADGAGHFENFLKAVASRKHTDLNADIVEGHLSSALCHTGNISYRLGQLATPGEIKEKIQGDRDAAETFGRMQEHLAANAVNIDMTKARLGMYLKMNSATERFIDNPEADKMLKRDYRKPYVVPDKV